MRLVSGRADRRRARRRRHGGAVEAPARARGPRRALRLARDTGVLVALLPEFEPSIGFDQESRYHDLTVDEHTFAVVQAAADARLPLPCGWRRSSTTSASRAVAWRGADGRLHYYARPGPRARPRAGRRRARRRGAAAAALPERAPRARRPDRPPPHVPASARATRSARAASSRKHGEATRASTCSTTRRPTSLGKRGADGEPRDVERGRARCVRSARVVRGGAGEPAPARRPRRRRHRPDRARLPSRPGARAAALDDAARRAVVDDPALNRRAERCSDAART